MKPKRNIELNLQEEVWHSMRNQLTVPLMVFGHRFTKMDLKNIYLAYKKYHVDLYASEDKVYRYKMTFTHAGIL